MKILVSAMMLFFSVNSAFAGTCYYQVDARLTKALKKRGHSYHGIRARFASEVIEDISDLSQAEKSQIGSLLRSGNYEFYKLTASDGPGGYQDLFVIGKKSCDTYRVYRLYEE